MQLHLLYCITATSGKGHLLWRAPGDTTGRPFLVYSFCDVTRRALRCAHFGLHNNAYDS